MTSLVVSPKNNEELKLLTTLLHKMGVSVRKFSKTERALMEEADWIEKGKKSGVADEAEIMKTLRK